MSVAAWLVLAASTVAGALVIRALGR